MMKTTNSSLSLIPKDIFARLQYADQLWYNLRQPHTSVSGVVFESNESLTTLDLDIVVTGGTLGILIATVLQKQGWRVAVMERGILRGREQEWNISRQELDVFLDLDLLTETELTTAIATKYNPGRISFYQGYEMWVKDILNIGVNPVYLLDTIKKKFIDAGGNLLENTVFKSTTVHPNGVRVETEKYGLNARLLIDAMGHFSPITKQARQGEKPEGVCLVVGSCAQGYLENNTGDLLVSFTPIKNQCQYFWEAFPAKDGRTTYLFTYVDAEPERFSLEFFMSEYFRLLPQYQNITLKQLQFKRFLFGFFPAYRKSPLNLTWNRILSMGDSSGSQSPVSFGGFGSMLRHLSRLSNGINDALKLDLLNHKNLSLLQTYQPNIAVTWLFQKTMSVGINQQIQPNQINDLMSSVFEVMDFLGEDVVKPFLQDVIKFYPLTRTLPLVKPNLVLPIIPQVGIPMLIDWLIHYLNLGSYTALYPMGKSLLPLLKKLPPQQQYYYQRWLDAWEYGAGYQ